MVTAPVGLKCPDCARQPRSAQATIKPQKLGLAVIAAIVAGAVIGSLSMVLFSRIPFISIIVAWVIGLAMGEIVLRASGNYRSPETAWIAAGGGIWAFVFPVVLITVSSPYAVNLSGLGVFYLLGIAIAGYVAYRRVL